MIKEFRKMYEDIEFNFEEIKSSVFEPKTPYEEAMLSDMYDSYNDFMSKLYTIIGYQTVNKNN